LPAARLKNLARLFANQKEQDGPLTRRPLAAANKMHNLVSVARLESRFLPFGPRKDIQIPFDRHASLIQTHFREQVCNRRAGVRGTRFSIHSNSDAGRHSA
jgi:hypothetical protein